MATSGDQQAEVRGRAGYQLAGVLRAERPHVARRCGQLEPEGLIRRLQPADHIAEVPIAGSEEGQVADSVGVIAARSDSVRDVLAVGEQFHNSRAGQHACGNLPGDPRHQLVRRQRSERIRGGRPVRAPTGQELTRRVRQIGHEQRVHCSVKVIRGAGGERDKGVRIGGSEPGDAGH